MTKTPELNRPRKVEPLFSRVNGIRDTLVASYRAGKGSPSQVSGNERENFIKNYLTEAYPKPFRFSTGFIMDTNGNKSGQLDIVVENQNSISFPVQAGSEERLFLAEMVFAVISVKSGLFSQWDEVLAEAEKLQQVQRSNQVPDGPQVPLFVVAYSGAKQIEKLREKIGELPEVSCIEAVCVLDEDLLAVRTSPEKWEFVDNDAAFLFFVSQLHKTITETLIVGQEIWEYACEVSER